MATAEKLDSFRVSAALIEKVSEERPEKKKKAISGENLVLDTGSSTGKRISLTKVAPSLDGRVEKKEKEQALITSLLAMIQAVQGLMLSKSKTQAQEAKVQSTLSNKLTDSIKVTYDEIFHKMDEIHKQIEKAKHASAFKRIGMSILGALAVLVVFAIDPAAGVFAATLFAMQQSGTTQKMFSGIDCPGLKIAAEVGFAIGVAALGGGVSAGLDSMVALSAAAETAGADAVTTATSEVAGTMLESAGSATAKEAALSAFQSSGFNIGLQALTSTDAIMDISKAINKKNAMWIALALGLALSVATLGAGTKGGASMTMRESLPKAAENSTVLTGVHGAVKAMRNPMLISGLSLTLASYTSYFGVKEGQANLERAKVQKSQGPVEALLQLFKQLNGFNASTSKQASEEAQKSMQSLRSSNKVWGDLTSPLGYAAQVLA